VLSIECFDTSDRKVYTEFEYDDDFSPMISGGSMDYPGEEDGSISSFTDDDDQLTFEFFDLAGGPSETVEVNINDGEDTGNEPSDDTHEVSQEVKTTVRKAEFTTNKMVVLQTRDGVFLRFRLSEVPEKKKGAVGVRGIKLNAGDEIDKVYIIGNGDKDSIRFHDKDLELMKIKLAKRDGKGTKPR